VKVHWLECFIIWSKNGPELCIVSIQSVYEDMESWKKKMEFGTSIRTWDWNCSCKFKIFVVILHPHCKPNGASTKTIF
jgi:hypothetical protein